MSILKPRLALLITSMISFSLVIFTIILQTYINLEPCKLCIYQRWSWLIAGIFSLLTYILFYKYTYTKILLIISFIAFAITSIISLYHAGIEQNFWNPSFSCNEILGLETTNIKDLEQAIFQQNSKNCSEVNFYILKLSLATWSGIFSLLCCLYLILSIKTMFKR